MNNRDFEIILYGATGFTGRLVAAYLASEHTDLKWAIAGRNLGKLEQLRDELGMAELPILTADSGDAAQLETMVSQASTVISTVWP